eukprot:413953-Prorocentrum_minimum.AAC.1
MVPPDRTACCARSYERLTYSRHRTGQSTPAILCVKKTNNKTETSYELRVNMSDARDAREPEKLQVLTPSGPPLDPLWTPLDRPMYNTP